MNSSNQCNITEFNEHQKIVLVASGFDEQTISAVAWLNSNKVDISCYQIVPYRLNDEILIDIKKILPIVQYDELYVDIANPSKENLQKGKKTGITLQSFAKNVKMLEWRIVNAGDTIVAKGTTEEALLSKRWKNASFRWTSCLYAAMAERCFWVVICADIRLCRIKRKRKNFAPIKRRVYELTGTAKREN